MTEEELQIHNYNVEASVKRIEKMLGEPVFLGIDSITEKVKFRLLMVSFVTIFIHCAGLEFGSESSFLGLEITGLESAHVKWGLYVLNAYLFVHFFMLIASSFDEWCIRTTGNKNVYFLPGKGRDEELDYPKEVRQSNLYSWFLDRQQSTNTAFHQLESYMKDNKFKDALESIKNYTKSGISKEESTMILKLFTDMNECIKHNRELFLMGRVDVSLKRFNDRHTFFFKWQNLRWFVFDLLLPLVVGAIAICLPMTW